MAFNVVYTIIWSLLSYRFFDLYKKHHLLCRAVMWDSFPGSVLISFQGGIVDIVYISIETRIFLVLMVWLFSLNRFLTIWTDLNRQHAVITWYNQVFIIYTECRFFLLRLSKASSWRMAVFVYKLVWTCMYLIMECLVYLPYVRIVLTIPLSHDVLYSYVNIVLCCHILS